VPNHHIKLCSKCRGLLVSSLNLSLIFWWKDSSSFWMFDTWSVTPIEREELCVWAPYGGKYTDCLMRRTNRTWMRLRAEIHNLYTCSLFDIIKKYKKAEYVTAGEKEIQKISFWEPYEKIYHLVSHKPKQDNNIKINFIEIDELD